MLVGVPPDGAMSQNKGRFLPTVNSKSEEQRTHQVHPAVLTVGSISFDMHLDLYNLL